MFVIRGDIVSGVVKKGMTMKVRFNSGFALSLPIDSVEFVDTKHGSQVGLTAICRAADELAFLQDLEIQDELIEILDSADDSQRGAVQVAASLTTRPDNRVFGKTMTPADDILRLAKEAHVVLLNPDSAGIPDIEGRCYAIVKIAREYPEQRVEISRAFQRILTDHDGCSWETVMFAMHLLRWPEMQAWFDERLRECVASHDWRGTSVYRAILDAFSDNWDDRDMFPSLAKDD